MIEGLDFERLRYWEDAFVVVRLVADVAGSSLHIEADAPDCHSFGYLGAGNFEDRVHDYPDASRPACCQDVAWASLASYSFSVVEAVARRGP